MLVAHHKSRAHLLHSLEWIEPIPDNPDLVRILPYVRVLKERVPLLEKCRLLRLPFIHGALAHAVQQSPPADGSHGQMETCHFYPNGTLHVLCT